MRSIRHAAKLSDEIGDEHTLNILKVTLFLLVPIFGTMLIFWAGAGA